MFSSGKEFNVSTHKMLARPTELAGVELTPGPDIIILRHVQGNSNFPQIERVGDFCSSFNMFPR
jgi:hypothetical protein